MTPTSWRQIEVPFARAVRSGHAGLASWSRLACGDEDLHGQSATSSTLIRGRSVTGLIETVDYAGPKSPGRSREFTPEPAITGGRGESTTAEIIPVLRNQLQAPGAPLPRDPS